LQIIGVVPYLSDETNIEKGIRRISALYTPYNYEMGIDLREQMSLCDAGDVFTIPANIEKSFDQVSSSTTNSQRY
jgi:agmatinase